MVLEIPPKNRLFRALSLRHIQGHLGKHDSHATLD